MDCPQTTCLFAPTLLNGFCCFHSSYKEQVAKEECTYKSFHCPPLLGLPFQANTMLDAGILDPDELSSRSSSLPLILADIMSKSLIFLTIASPCKEMKHCPLQ
jgi:hypothetical protein